MDIEDLGLGEHGAHGIVSVHNLGLGRSTAACSCGWAGRRRRLKAAATQDAWAHCLHEQCSVSSPLVVVW
ncbi:hypothetical protein CIW52_19900 [Mycolicibacterium sp. P9-64]|nr:hypothetical protein CIW52_19900 [Mycolicibacterium sp. P9-64]